MSWVKKDRNLCFTQINDSTVIDSQSLSTHKRNIRYFTIMTPCDLRQASLSMSSICRHSVDVVQSYIRTFVLCSQSWFGCSVVPPLSSRSHHFLNKPFNPYLGTCDLRVSFQLADPSSSSGTLCTVCPTIPASFTKQTRERVPCGNKPFRS